MRNYTYYFEDNHGIGHYVTKSTNNYRPQQRKQRSSTFEVVASDLLARGIYNLLFK